MTEVIKTHPCSLSKEGVATELYCRAMNRQMNTHLKCCAASKCVSPWRFCPICITLRASPVHTLRQGGCRDHGQVADLDKDEILSRYRSLLPVQAQAVPTILVTGPSVQVTIKRKDSRSENAEVKRGRKSTPQSLARRLDNVIKMRLRERKRRIKSLSQRLARCRVTPTDAVLKPFSLWTYQVAVIENTALDIRNRTNGAAPSLWEVCKVASDYLGVGPNGLLLKMREGLDIRDFNELGIRPPRKCGVADAPRRKVTDYDFERFEREFDEECRESLMRMSAYRPMDTELVIREVNALLPAEWSDWDVLVDPLDVAYAVEALCKDGRMNAVRAAKVFRKNEYWIEIVLRLHKLTPVVRGLIGPKASSEWRLQFGQAVLVASKQPGKQLALAKDEMWRIVRSRYKMQPAG